MLLKYYFKIKHIKEIDNTKANYYGPYIINVTTTSRNGDHAEQTK